MVLVQIFNAFQTRVRLGFSKKFFVCSALIRFIHLCNWANFSTKIVVFWKYWK